MLEILREELVAAIVVPDTRRRVSGFVPVLFFLHIIAVCYSSLCLTGTTAPWDHHSSGRVRGSQGLGRSLSRGACAGQGSSLGEET